MSEHEMSEHEMSEHEMKERYGAWAGMPKGRPGDPNKCIKEIQLSGRMIQFRQCTRKRGHGPKEAYCEQHVKRWEKTTKGKME